MSSLFRRIIACLSLTLVLSFGWARAQGTSTPLLEATASNDPCLRDPQCKALVDSGRVLSQANQYEGACLAYKAAHARHPVPWLLINIGRMEHKLGLYKSAIGNYRTFVELTRDSAQEALLQKVFQFLQQAQDALVQQRAQPGMRHSADDGAPHLPASAAAPELVKAQADPEPDLALPPVQSSVRYREVRAPRPALRVVLGSLLIAGGVGMLGGGAALLHRNGSCADEPVAPSLVCSTIYSTLTPGLSLTLAGVGALAAGIVTIAVPGKRMLKLTVDGDAETRSSQRAEAGKP